MSSDIAVKIENVSKCYQIYDSPGDRLKQFFLPRLQHQFGISPRRYYQEFWALKDVSFEIRKGEAVGIVGRNGSGKSTLLQLICGTLNPTVGNIQASGRISALLELGSGFNPEFTGRENVYMNGAIVGASHDEVDARFDDIADFADIGPFMDQPVKTYSSGMVVRLAFSVAINLNPEILVVDEALAVGDELFQRKCFAKIENMRAAGTTILFVSHSAAQTTELCDRAILLDSGCLIMSGVPSRVVPAYQKLLYAPPDARIAIRDELRGKDTSSDEALSIGEINVAQSEPISTPDETFDPNFVPVSTVEFESRGARIGEVRLTNADGQSVNGLLKGNRYTLAYTVEIEQTVTNVRFGMLIKSSTGLPLGGCMSVAELPDSIPVALTGEAFAVEFSFECMLNPGTYFLNAGVFGADFHGEETVLHRKADVLAFRVMPMAKNRSTEMVDFGFDFKVGKHA